MFIGVHLIVLFRPIIPQNPQAWWSTSSSMAWALAPVAGWMPLMPTASDGPSSSSWRPGWEIFPHGNHGILWFLWGQGCYQENRDLDRGFFNLQHVLFRTSGDTKHHDLTSRRHLVIPRWAKMFLRWNTVKHEQLSTYTFVELGVWRFWRDWRRKITLACNRQGLGGLAESINWEQRTRTQRHFVPISLHGIGSTQTRCVPAICQLLFM